MRISMNDDYKRIVYDLLCEMTGNEVLHLMTDYHGMQLLDEGFIEFLDREGVIVIVDDEEDGDEN